MMDKKQLVLKASELALKTRLKLEYSQSDAICIYDAVKKCDINLRFVDIPYLEGMYLKDKNPRIFIGSHRPAGRMSFTCAHELGHHVFNHGSEIDLVGPNEVSFQSRKKEEFLADCFGAFFLMPKALISNSFLIRKWTPSNCSADKFYIIANSLGVSYEALISHMSMTLRMLSYSKAESLKKFKPKDIKASLLGIEIKEDVYLVDEYWGERAIDMQVGDYAILPVNAEFEGKCAEVISAENKRIIYKAIKPGIGRFFIHQIKWASYTRVSRRNYFGLSQYRHLEEISDE